jgi:GNAT superfamily N-acetyltransferase
VIEVTPAQPGHVQAIAALAEEMDRFYGASVTESPGLRIRQINDAVFTDPPAAYVLLAWDSGQLAGLACYSFLWPAAGLTRSLFLKELYVIKAARGKGIGTLLMRRLYGIAAQHGCSRLEWTTERGNDDARAFYAHLGAPIHEDKLFYRLEGGALPRPAPQ